MDPVTELVRAFARTVGVPDAADEPPGLDPLPRSWRRLAEAGLAHPGLAFATWSTAGQLSGPLLPILANCPDVAALLERLQRFHPLFGRDQVVLTVRDGAAVSLRAPDGSPPHPDTVDAFFALLRRAIRQLTQDAATTQVVRLRRRPPIDDAAYRELLGDVRFGCSDDRCLFAPDALAVPIRHADPTILSMIEPYAQRLVTERDEQWTGKVAAIVSARLPERATLPAVATELAMSTRALQMRLAEDGATFSSIVDAVQRDRALALLANLDIPITHIAGSLGFSSPAGFSRAVRRWTGRSPTDVRRGS